MRQKSKMRKHIKNGSKRPHSNAVFAVGLQVMTVRLTCDKSKKECENART